MSMRLSTNQLVEHALSSVSLEEMAEQLVPQLMDLTGARAGSVLVRDGDVLFVHTAYGLKSNRADQARVPLGVGVTGQAALSGEIQWIPDVDEVENHIEGVRGSKWEWTIPITHDERNTSVVLDFESDSTDRPGGELRRSIEQRLDSIELPILTRAENARLRRSYREDGLSSLMDGEYFLDYLDDWLRDHPDRSGLLTVLELDPDTEDSEVGTFRELQIALESMGTQLNSVLCRDHFAGRLYGNVVGLFVPNLPEEEARTFPNDLSESLQQEMYVKKINYSVRETEEVTAQELVDRAFVDLQFDEDERTGVSAKGLDEILRSGDIQLSVQPIYRGNEEVVGREVLVRGPEDSPLHSPKRLFEAAYQEDRVVELDTLIARHSLETVPMEDNETLFLNVERKSIVNEQWRRTLVDLVHRTPEVGRVCVEITEHGDMTDLTVPLKQLRRELNSSIRFAIDDFGTGASNFEAIIELDPDVLKIDRSLIRNIHEHFGKRSLIESILTFSTTTDIRLLAEGIEEEPELETLRDLGIEWVQGFYFAEPRKVTKTNGTAEVS